MTGEEHSRFAGFKQSLIKFSFFVAQASMQSTSAAFSIPERFSDVLKEIQESREEVRSLKEELQGTRKELQTLNACFCSSSTKLQLLTQQNAQFLDLIMKQGQHIQVSLLLITVALQ